MLLLGDNINDIDTIRHLPTGVTALKIAFANRCFFFKKNALQTGCSFLLDTGTSYDYVHDLLKGALRVCVCVHIVSYINTCTQTYIHA